MHSKQELLEKLTGIQSSRRSYYKELTLVVEEMKQKNKQLEVINQLTQIQINATWPDVSTSIASQLIQLFVFDRMILTLLENDQLCCYASRRDPSTESGWYCEVLSPPFGRKAAVGAEDVNCFVQGTLPDSSASTVLLRSQRKQTFGFLTLQWNQSRPFPDDQRRLFAQIAEHVAISVENILMFRDLSKKVNLEAQLVQSAKMAALGEMAAGVAHELNSPLTAILGNIQLLQRECELTDHQQMMQDIYQCGIRCKKIIQNLLIFSRQEEFHFESIPINELVEDTLGLIGYQLSVSGVTVNVQLSDERLFVQASRHQIEQIVINLLLNARDALQDQDHPTITITTGRSEWNGQPFVSLSVTDNGVGMTAELLPQIFQPFFTTKSTTKGTGLGLSVSLGIAEAHGGRLTVESKPGLYSTFTLLLPLLAKEEDGNEQTGTDCR